jgi:hypothetical protein
MIAVDVFPGGAIVKPATAILTKSGRPVDIMFAEDGWAVSVDGKSAWDALGEPATTPCTVNLSIGKHEILLAKYGFKEISWKGDVTDKTGSIEVKGKVEKGLQTVIRSKGKAINLLALIDPKKDAVIGTWSWKDGCLMSDGTRWARLQIPYQPPEEYDLRLSFTRKRGNDSVDVILTKSDHKFLWNMGGWGNTASGFELINGVPGDNNPTTVKGGLENGKKYLYIIKVRKDMISVISNDKVIVEYKTDFNDLSLRSDWNIRNNKNLGIGSWESTTIFHTIEVIEMSESRPRQEESF